MRRSEVFAPKLGVSDVSRPVPRTAQLVYSRDDSLQSDASAKARVLIVEDDFLVGSQIEAALSDAGFEVIGVAQSADEAIAFAAESNPQLVVMDIRLSGPKDGVDAAVQLYSDHGIRCVFATAHSDIDVRRRAEAANPLGWIQKPYSMRALVDAVRHGLDKAG